MCGPVSVIERFGGAAVHYPPGAFGQNNLEVAEAIIAHVRAQIPPGATVTEFYAGVGAISLSVLERAGELRINEGESAIPARSAAGARRAGARSPGTRDVVVAGAAGEVCEAAAGAQVVIVDPPRKGLEPQLTEYLGRHPPERLVYVSCGLDSFLADTARLTAPGTLRLTSLSAFNLLPYTDHVETRRVLRGNVNEPGQAADAHLTPDPRSAAHGGSAAVLVVSAP